MANTWVIDEPTVIPPIETVQTTEVVPVGTIVRAKSGTNGNGEFIFLEGVASLVTGNWVTYNRNSSNVQDYGAVDLAFGGNKGPVAVAMAAPDAGEYGWYCISGQVTATVGSGCAANADLYFSGANGSLDDAIVAGDAVYNARTVTAESGGTATVSLARPFSDDGI